MIPSIGNLVFKGNKRFPLFILCGAIIISGIILFSSHFALSNGNSATTAQTLSWVSTTGEGISVPACASATNNQPTCNGGTGTVTITWSATNHSGCDHVNLGVYLNGVQQPQTVGGLSCAGGSQTISGLQSGAHYTYNVYYDDPNDNALDVAGGSFDVPNCGVAIALRCSPTPQSVSVGDVVNVRADYGSGSGYTWTAPGANISSGSGQTFSTTYSAGGSYAITAHDSLGATNNCSISVTTPETPTCTANFQPSSGAPGTPTTANWSSPTSGFGASTANSFVCSGSLGSGPLPSGNPGSFNLPNGIPADQNNCTLTMDAGGGRVATCNANVGPSVPGGGGTPAVSCLVSPTSATTGQSVTWTASPSNFSGTPTYSWSGTDGLSGTTQSVSKSYSTIGTKTGSVTATSGGQTAGPTACTNSVSVSSGGGGGLPDLAPQGFWTTIPTIYEGDIVPLYARIKNIGTAPTPGTSETWMVIDYDNDQPGNFNAYINPGIPTPSLAPGEETIVSANWTAVCPVAPAPCTHRIEVKADSGNVITESNEGNNTLANLITVNPANALGRIDRVGDDLMVGSAPAGTQARVVENAGSAMPWSSLNPAYFPGLVPGSLYRFQTTDVAGYTETAWSCRYAIGGADCAPGTGLVVGVTCNGTTCEAYDSAVNGYVSKMRFRYTLTSTLSDLAVISASPSSATNGQNTTISVVVKNIGTLPLPAMTGDLAVDWGNDFQVACNRFAGRCDAYIAQNIPIPALSAGQSATINIPWTATCNGLSVPCTNGFNFTADRNNDVVETDDINNNWLWWTIQVSGGGSPTCTLNFVPSSGAPNSPTQLQWTSNNDSDNILPVSCSGSLGTFTLSPASGQSNLSIPTNTQTCTATARSSSGSTYTCNATITATSLCGNGIVDSGEQCDGSNLNGATCSSLGFGGGGSLACYPAGSANQCKFDSSACLNTAFLNVYRVTNDLSTTTATPPPTNTAPPGTTAYFVPSVSGITVSPSNLISGNPANYTVGTNAAVSGALQVPVISGYSIDRRFCGHAVGGSCTWGSWIASGLICNASVCYDPSVGVAPAWVVEYEFRYSPSVNPPLISATPRVIPSGGTSVLTWSAPGATSCTASASPATSQWQGSVSLSGSKNVSPVVTTIYTITCDTGTASAKVSVGIIEETRP